MWVCPLQLSIADLVTIIQRLKDELVSCPKECDRDNLRKKIVQLQLRLQKMKEVREREQRVRNMCCTTSLILTLLRMKSPSHMKRSVPISLSGSPLSRGYCLG